MNKICRIILLGVLLRLLVMPFTMHPDLAFLYYFPSLLKSSGVWDIYSYLKANYSQSIAQLGWFYYPPLTYYFFGLYTFVISWLSHSYMAWMLEVGKLTDGGGLVQHYLILPGTDQIYRDLFLMKLPYLFFDGAIIWLLSKIIDNNKQALSAITMWCVSPIIIYATFMFGQFDIIPAAFVLLALYLVKIKQNGWAVIALGVAAAFKSYSLLFCLPTILVVERDNWRRLKLLALFALPYLIFLVPSYLNSGSYAFQVLLPQVMVGKQLGANNLLSRGLNLLFLVTYLYIIYRSFRLSFRRDPYLYLLDSYLIILLLYFASSFPSIHYLVWLVPLAILKAVEDKQTFWLFVALQVLLFVVVLASRPMLFGLLAPVQPLYFPALPGLAEMAGTHFKYGYLQFAAMKLFLLTALVWSAKLLWRNRA
jgi:hypothetical protein